MRRLGATLAAGTSLVAASVIAPSSVVAAPSDPTAGQARASQWWLAGLGVSKAQEVTRGEGVTVCVVDHAFDGTHPDLVGADVSMGDDLTHAKPSDFLGTIAQFHGTSMTALIVGQGSGPGRSEGTLGTAPKAKVRWVTVAQEGEPSALDGIKACADLGADVISVSLDGAGHPEVMGYAQARDAVVVVGTGNGGSSQEINDLAGLWGVLSVTGVDASLTRDPRANTAPARFPFSEIKPEPKNEDRAGSAVAGVSGHCYPEDWWWVSGCVWDVGCDGDCGGDCRSGSFCASGLERSECGEPDRQDDETVWCDVFAVSPAWVWCGGCSCRCHRSSAVG